MDILITILHVLICIFLVLAILLQSGKGGGLASSLGGGMSSSSVLGGRSATTFLTKATAVLAGVFFIASTAFFAEWLMRLQSFQAFDELARWNLNDQLIGQFLQTMSVVLLFLLPGVTMGFFAAEKTQGTHRSRRGGAGGTTEELQ